jgi:hypothetical protein
MEKQRDVLISPEATHAQGWLVNGGDEDDEEVEPGSVVGEAMGSDEALQNRRSTRNVRELHEEDFESEDDEEEDNEEVDFDSDGDQVLEGYGEEEDEI